MALLRVASRLPGLQPQQPALAAWLGLQAFSTTPPPTNTPAAAETAPAPPPPTNEPQDYAVVLKTVNEISQTTQAVPKEVGYVAGVPLEAYNRKVRIFTPARSASQQGMGNTTYGSAPTWKLEFDTQDKWVNPLIGWTSTADPLENVARVALNFYTKDEAIAFANKHGWEYEVTEPHKRRTLRTKRYWAYGDNFSTKRKGLPDLSHLPSNRGAAATPPPPPPPSQ